MSNLNPYQAPADVGHHAQRANVPIDESAQAVFWAWERLRLYYNGVLTVIVVISLPLLVTEVGNPRAAAKQLMLDALIANTCFCVGPIVEGYVGLLGIRRRSARLYIFAAGMFLACVAAIGEILRLSAPGT